MSNTSVQIVLTRDEVEALIREHLLARGARRIEFMVPIQSCDEFVGMSVWYYGKLSEVHK